jgi:predicted Zn-dependent protease
MKGGNNMLTRKQCKSVIDYAVKYGESTCASGVEIALSDDNQATARFANNGMTQHISPLSNACAAVRVIVNGRQGHILTEDLTKAGMRQSVDCAIAIARNLSDATTRAMPLVRPNKRTQALQRVKSFDRSATTIDATERGRVVKSIIEIAKKNKLTAAGVFSAGEDINAIGNSKGLYHCERGTEVECSITMTGGSSSGWAKSTHWQYDQVDPIKLAEIAVRKAKLSRNPITMRPGRYTVILEPSATLDLLCFLWGGLDFTGTGHIDGLSCFAGKIGIKVLGDNITISDNVYHPFQYGNTFDEEGLSRRKVVLVKNGIIQRPVMGRRSAKTMGGLPTGHCTEQPNVVDECPINLVVEGGDTSLEDMIASTERGILLTRAWYTNEVDANEKVITGMTRDGTFLVENGKLKRGLKNMRFNISLIEVLNNVVALGPAVLAAGEESAIGAVVPPMKIERFRFSSTTHF